MQLGRASVNGYPQSCARVHHRATCPRPLAPEPLVTIASLDGGRLGSGTRSWMHLRRVATQHDKLPANYLAFVKLASIRIWRRANESRTSPMNPDFAAIILGGTGQVGGAAVAALLAIPECREVVMVTRKPIAARPRVRNVVLDTGAADFAERTAALAREALSQGPVSAVSCVGVGSGSMRWSEEELKRLELGVVGAFARGCHDAGITQFCLLSAAGSTARSRFRYVARHGHEGRHRARRRFYPPGDISPRHHRRQRAHPGLGRLVGKPRAWAVRQYRSANSRPLNRRGDSVTQSGDW